VRRTRLDSIRAFPDESVREQLSIRQNFRETVEEAAPDIASHLDFDRAVLASRTLRKGDWRVRKSDLFWEVPLRPETGVELLGGSGTVMVCVLIEHKSASV